MGELATTLFAGRHLVKPTCRPWSLGLYWPWPCWYSAAGALQGLASAHWACGPRLAEFACARPARLLVVALTTSLLVWGLSLELQGAGVALVGAVPSVACQPCCSLPAFRAGSSGLQLLDSAVLIAIIGYVESVSVGQHPGGAPPVSASMPDQELVGLGAANVASAFLRRYTGERRFFPLGG